MQGKGRGKRFLEIETRLLLASELLVIDLKEGREEGPHSTHNKEESGFNI